MFLKPDLFARGSRTGLPALLALAVLAGCSSGPGTPRAEEMTGRRITTQPAYANPSQPALPANPATLPASDAVARLLAYADRLRLMPPVELGQEAARLGEPGTPTEQLRLALALSQLRQLPDLVRAQELLARVLGNATAEAQALHPLARLLAARYAEQRRLEELLEKQTQQTREVQRRLDLTHERLEALKAIERSLTSRQPAATPPANRAHRTTP